MLVSVEELALIQLNLHAKATLGKQEACFPSALFGTPSQVYSSRGLSGQCFVNNGQG